MGLSYEESGVGYDSLDTFKRLCQREAARTVVQLVPHGMREVKGIRGESAYLIETDDAFLAHVEEGLGTKNLVADAMLELSGVSYYRNIGIDTVATIVNDMITCGALPISVAMHAGVGDSKWFDDEKRSRDLAEGFAEGCMRSGAVWGGGETPALKGIVDPKTLVLAGSAIGQIKPKENRISADVRAGDLIVLLASSGVHTNGLTLCRALAERLPQRYLTKLPDGRTYGEALLDPSEIYVKFVADLLRENVHPHYVAHITGHGWRKLMRLDIPLVYRMTDVGRAPAVFEFLMKHGPIDVREAYATFNMGAGFAAYVAPRDADRVLQIAHRAGHEAWIGGEVVSDGGRKAVEILPAGVSFEHETLKLR